MTADVERLRAALSAYVNWAEELSSRCDSEWCIGAETFWDDRPVEFDDIVEGLSS